MRPVLATILFTLLAFPSFADTVRTGTDTFISGEAITETLAAPGDVFAGGGDVGLRGVAQNDIHAAGYTVEIEATTTEDVYAAGANVTLRGEVGEDATLAGMSVRVGSTATIAGNLRAAGNSITIEGPVAQGATLAGRTVTLDAPIGGDVRILAKTLRFGTEARIDGTLTYSAEDPIDIPASVVPPERVVFERLDMGAFGDAWEEASDHFDWEGPSSGTILGGFVMTLLFFVILGALALTFLPKTVDRLRGNIARRPWITVLSGVIGLSILFGAFPITALTIVGLPLLPFLLLGIIVAWTLGYALGAYAVAMRLFAAFGAPEEPGLALRLVALAAGITVVAILNFIPFVGWVANYTLVLFGIGAMSIAVFEWMIPDIDPALTVDMQPVPDKEE